jgi:hypothetical protein
MERLAIEIVVVLALIGGFAWYERHQGAADCKQANIVAEAKQETHNAVTTAIAVQSIVIEKDTYAKDKAAPVSVGGLTPVVVCVRNAPPATVPAAQSPGPIGNGGTGLPEGNSRSVLPVTDISVPAIEVGRDANAQVKFLKSYIHDVCLVR